VKSRDPDERLLQDGPDATRAWMDGAVPFDPPKEQQLLLPLTFIDAASWQDADLPPRRWLVHNRIPVRNVTLLSGDGAAGKTTIVLQLAVGTVRTGDWLGAVIDEVGPAIFITAEEDDDEVHRRLAAIVSQRDLGFRDLAGLKILCLPGEDAALGTADRAGIVKPTSLFMRLLKEAQVKRPRLIIIEAAADVFAGNENDRGQVRQFITLLRKLAIAADAAILLISHPSVAGLNTGTGASGSTAWNNSVRSRLYFTSATTKDGNELDPDLRELKVMKSNYGPPGETVRVRWHRGAYVMEASKSPTERAAAEANIDDTFLRCLDAKTAQGINVVAATGRGYAPSVFEAMPEAAGFKRKAFAPAMERLLSAKRIRVDTFGPPSKQRTRLVRVQAPAND
jgi:RecA-family ATPase